MLFTKIQLKDRTTVELLFREHLNKHDIEPAYIINDPQITPLYISVRSSNSIFSAKILYDKLCNCTLYYSFNQPPRCKLTLGETADSAGITLPYPNSWENKNRI